MNEPQGADWSQLTESATEILAETPIVDELFALLFTAVVAVPIVLTHWLREELRTPKNSRPPTIIPAEPGMWSGIIVVDRNQSIAWILVLVDQDTRNVNPPPTPSRPAPTCNRWWEESDDPFEHPGPDPRGWR